MKKFLQIFPQYLHLTYSIYLLLSMGFRPTRLRSCIERIFKISLSDYDIDFPNSESVVFTPIIKLKNTVRPHSDPISIVCYSCRSIEALMASQHLFELKMPLLRVGRIIVYTSDLKILKSPETRPGIYRNIFVGLFVHYLFIRTRFFAQGTVIRCILALTFTFLHHRLKKLSVTDALTLLVPLLVRRDNLYKSIIEYPIMLSEDMFQSSKVVTSFLNMNFYSLYLAQHFGVQYYTKSALRSMNYSQLSGLSDVQETFSAFRRT